MRRSLADWSADALHVLAWWLAATNRWRTAARCCRAARPCLPSAVASEDEEERTGFESARLRLLGPPLAVLHQRRRPAGRQDWP